MTRWLKRCGIGAATLFLIYVIGGFVGVPLILKHVILAKVDKQIVGSLETGSVRFNPFTWVLEVKDFKGLTSEGETATSFAKFRINLQPTTIFAHEKVVHEILLDQPKGLVRINPDGDLNLLSLFGMKEAKPKDPNAQPTVIPSLLIESLEVRKASLELKIESFDQAFERKLQDISFVMNGVRSHATHNNPYEFSLLSQQGEKITIEGILRLDPLSSTGTIHLEQLQLPDFSSFASSLLDGEIRSGRLDLSFDYRFQPLLEEPEFGTHNGQLALHDFDLRQAGGEESLQRIDSLQIDDFSLDILNRQVGMDLIKLDGAALNVVRDEGGLRLQGQKKTKVTASSPANAGGEETNGKEIVTGLVSGDHDIGESLTKASQSLKLFGGGDKQSGPSPLAIRVGKLEASKSQLALVDQAIQPSAKISLKEITLNAGPYLSEGSQPVILNLGAAMAGPGSGNIKLSGEVSAHDFHQFSQLKLELDRLPMAPFAPYATPAIGRAPTQGSLTADLAYTIRGGILEGSNELTIQDMKLGAQDESPDAPKLPLDLAIAILEDTHGTIEIDLPVKGDLTHPQFSFDQIISHAIANVVNKLATAPFSMLGNLQPDGQDFDQDFIAFEPGASLLTDKGGKIVEAIATVMEARPRIDLVLRGYHSKKSDAKAMAEARFSEQLVALRDKGKDREDAIKSLYRDLPRELRKPGLFLPESEVMEEAVRESIRISEEDLKALADARAQATFAALTGAGIDKGRVQVDASSDADSPRVEMSLEILD